MAAAAAAGGGGGVGGIFSAATSGLLDCTTEVRSFMDMIGVSALDAPPSVDQFMTFIQNPKGHAASFASFISQIKPFKNPMTMTGQRRYHPLKRGNENIAGSFGRIWGSADPEERIIWKEVPEIVAGRPVLPMILQECFIQYIVSQKFPDFAIGLSDICKDINKTTGLTTLFIKMERANDDLFALIDHLTTVVREDELLDNEFYSIMRPILVNLIKCNRGLNFVHRDMKTDNFVYIQQGTGIAIKMIDFGMACLTVLADGHYYKVVAMAPKYQLTTPCLPQQDMLLFLYEFLTVYKTLIYGERTKQFLNTVLNTGLRSEMAGRIQKFTNYYKYTEDRQKLLAAYNTHGTLTAPGGLAHYLTPEYVYDVLEEIFIRPGSAAAGGAAAGVLARQQTPTLPSSPLPPMFVSAPSTPVRPAEGSAPAASVPLFASSAAAVAKFPPSSFATPPRKRGGGKRSRRISRNGSRRSRRSRA